MGLKIFYVEFLDCYMETMGYFVRVNLNLIAIEANYLAIGPIFILRWNPNKMLHQTHVFTRSYEI